MAQIIKHRRGTLAELNGVTLNNGELGIVTSSVASIGDAVLKTAVVIGNSDGTNRLSIGRIITGNATPDLSGITGGAAFNNMLYHETDAKTLLVLNTGGNTNLDLTGNIKNREIAGTLDITGRVDAQAGLDVTGSLNTSGNTVLGDASGDTLTINAATINPANIAAGTDNTVVVYNGSTLVTDEIDSKVWAGNLVDTDGSGANNELVTWSDSDSIIGEGNLTFDGSTLTVTGNAVVSSHISSSANITGSDIYASGGFYGDGSNLTGVAQDIDSLASYGAATIHQTQDEFLISDNGTEKKITFSNLQDSVFADISGDILIAAGGAATIQANSVALTTDTTGDYIATITGGTGIDSSASGEGAATTLTLDLNELTTETTLAQGDFIPMVDTDDSSASNKITFSNFEDEIFGNVTGDIAIAAGGTATIQANSVALTTDTTGNYVATVTGGTGIDSDGATTGEGIAHSLTLDLNELGAETSIAQADFVAMVDATDDGSQKITFSDFEDQIFGNVSGDIAIAAGGAATVTGATTNAALTAGTGISAGGTFDGATARTFALDLNELTEEVIATGDHIAFNDAGDNGQHKETVDDIMKIGPALVTEAAIADGDYITFLDGGSTGEAKKEALADVATLFAGDGLQAASSVMAVDVSDFAGTGLEDDSSENLRLATQGTGISGGGGSTLSITPAQTAITSVYNTSLKVGTAAAQEYVTFGTANEVNTFIDNSEVLSVTSAGIDVTGNATVSGNLIVNGTTTYISSSTLEIGDNIIVLNSAGAAVDSGIQVIDAISTAHTGSLLWNATNDYWYSGISGSTHYRHTVQASTSDLTENKPVIVDGSGRLESSANITDDGSTVDFNDVDLTSIDKLEGFDTNTYIDLGASTLIVTKGTLQPAANNGDDLGATLTRYKNLWLEGNADLEGDIDVNGTANLDNTDIDGTLDVAGVADFQARVDAQLSLAVTGSVYISAGASVAAASASLVSFRNDSNTQLGYLASADTQAITTGLVGYNTSTGNLTISSVIDGGSF